METFGKGTGIGPGVRPQGGYPTSGQDSWIAISCKEDQQWAQLAREMNRGDLADLPVAERHNRHDELDELISSGPPKSMASN